VLVFVNVDGWGKTGCGERLIPATFIVGFAEKAVHAILQGGKLTERLPTGKNCHGNVSFCAEVRDSATPFLKLRCVFSTKEA
jgi:hypothetical protein